MTATPLQCGDQALEMYVRHIHHLEPTRYQVLDEHAHDDVLFL